MLSPSRFGGDHGSSLMLWPTAVLIVLLLASIAFDFSVILMGRRQLVWAADAAANDAATYGLDQAYFRETASIRLDLGRAGEAVSRSLAARDLDFELVGRPQVSVAGGEIEVTLTARIPFLFADGIPGLPDFEVVTVTGDARPTVSSP